MKGWAAAALMAAAILAGCGRPEPAAAPQAEGPAPAGQPLSITQAATGCAAAAEGAWEPQPGEVWPILATSEGATCAEAVGLLIVRTPAGGEAMRLEIPASASPVLFAAAETPDSMADALQTWATPDLRLSTAAQLPAWPAGAEAPAAGEFPFYVDEGVDRARYVALRDAGWPMLCLVQGGESLGCHVLDPATGRLVKVGAQSFPG